MSLSERSNGAVPPARPAPHALPPKGPREPVLLAAAAGPGDAALHWIMLLLAVGVLGASMFLHVGGSRRIELPFSARPLPGVCAYRNLTGHDCPGCGMTRCFVSLAHGDLAAAWRFNPAGLLVFAFLAFQVPYRIGQLWRQRRGLPPWNLSWAALPFVWVLIAALLAQWAVRIFWGGGS